MHTLNSNAPGLPYVLHNHPTWQGCQWHHGYDLNVENIDLDGFNYEGLVWQTEDVEKPTEAELLDLWENTYRAQWQRSGLTSPWTRLRAKRDRLIAETDWVVSRAVDASNDGLGIQLPQVWVDYRQALRDLPANTTDPANPVWPTKP
jgi:hypothetical protein